MLVTIASAHESVAVTVDLVDELAPEDKAVAPHFDSTEGYDEEALAAACGGRGRFIVSIILAGWRRSSLLAGLARARLADDPGRRRGALRWRLGACTWSAGRCS